MPHRPRSGRDQSPDFDRLVRREGRPKGRDESEFKQWLRGSKRVPLSTLQTTLIHEAYGPRTEEEQRLRRRQRQQRRYSKSKGKSRRARGISRYYT